MNRNQSFLYGDILHHSYPRPNKRARMSMVERAAQFAPFAALTGYDATIAETARLTGQRIELDESEKAALNMKLQQLQPLLVSSPTVTVTYFVPDRQKDGGSYTSITGQLKKIDSYRSCLLVNEASISLESILNINCELLNE